VSGKVRIAFVVAVAENGVIGRDGKLPWRLPADLKWFRKVTLGKPVIMGRKTYESIGKPLDGRDTIVVTRRRNFAAAGVRVANSVEEAIALGRELADQRGVSEVMIIGGADIFRATLAHADRIYLTLVHGTPAGDTWFDIPDARIWRETARDPLPQAANDRFPAELIVLERQG
jgi:dihydrofolate reductase